MQDIFGTEFSAHLFCSCSFLSMGQHSQRILHATPELVGESVRKAKAPNAVYMNLVEMKDYALVHAGVFEITANSSFVLHILKNKNVRSDSGRKELSIAWGQLIDSVNVTCNGQCEFRYDKNSLHTRSHSDWTIKRKTNIPLACVSLRPPPRPPARSKWTMLGPACDLFFLVWVLGLDRGLRAGPSCAWGPLRHDRSDSSWHQIAGSYRSKFEKIMTDAVMLSVASLCFVLEPLRFLTA